MATSNGASTGKTALVTGANRGGAQILVEMATVPNDGPNGGWFDDDGSIVWGRVPFFGL